MEPAHIEIFRCCLATGFSEKVVLYAACSHDAESVLQHYLTSLDKSLPVKYNASVKRVIRGTSKGVKIFYSPKRGERYYLFIKWYEEHKHVIL